MTPSPESDRVLAALADVLGRNLTEDDAEIADWFAKGWAAGAEDRITRHNHGAHGGIRERIANVYAGDDRLWDLSYLQRHWLAWYAADASIIADALADRLNSAGEPLAASRGRGPKPGDWAT